jgi:hypothetical protein
MLTFVKALKQAAPGVRRRSMDRGISDIHLSHVSLIRERRSKWVMRHKPYPIKNVKCVYRVIWVKNLYRTVCLQDRFSVYKLTKVEREREEG